MLSVIKIEAHTKWTEHKSHENALIGFHAEATTESVKTVAQVDKVHYTSTKD